MDNDISSLNIPLVSVIIPTYNRAHVIHKALNSVLNQDYKNLEIIIIDDGSIDNTDAIVSAFNGVIYIKNKHEGQSEARNYGLGIAKGEYIATLDSDDEWNENYLSVSIEYILNHQLDFFFSNCHYFSSSDKKPINYFQSGSYNKFNNCGFTKVGYKDFRYNLISGLSKTPSSGVIVRKNYITTKWDKRVKIGDDIFLQTELIVLNPQSCIGKTYQILWNKNRSFDSICDGKESISYRNDHICDLNLLLSKLESNLTLSELDMIKMRILQNYIYIIFLSIIHFDLNLIFRKSIYQLFRNPKLTFKGLVLGIFKYFISKEFR